MLHSQPSSHSPTLAEQCETALELQIAGRLDLAETMYRQILAIEPLDPTANHCYGILLMRLKRTAEGLPLLLAALNKNPTIIDYWLGCLEALLLLGKTEEAQKMLSIARQHGFVGASLEDFAQRLAAKRAASSVDPAPSASAPPTAAAPPNANPPPLKFLGPAVREPSSAGPAAATPAKRSRREKPMKPRQLEVRLMDMLRSRDPEALALARSLTERYPERGFGWKVLGTMLGRRKDNAGAIAALRTAVRLLPEDPEVLRNMGVALFDGGRFAEAESYQRRALKITPNSAALHNDLAVTLYSQSRIAEAQVNLRRSIALSAPDSPQSDGTRSALLMVLCFDPSIDAESLFAEHCLVGEHLEARLRSTWSRHSNNPDPERRLKVGIVSADLRNHSVTNFIEPVLAPLMQFPTLEFYAYYNHDVHDAVTQRLRGLIPRWRDVLPLSDEQLAQQIRDDAIDILIDLSGHTALNRLRAFAHRPAPIQASWIGYPATTGLRAMDYYLADPHFLPPGQFDRQFTEKLVYLPAQAPFQPHPAAPAVNALPALAQGHVTLGSFNRFHKVNETTLDLWARLLNALPSARMLIGATTTDLALEPIVERFAAAGVSPERLMFHPRSGMDEYLALHHRVDLCLDTYPYNGGTTNIHAMWMGVPTLTLAGDKPPARAGAAILSQVGLQGFTAGNAEEFVAMGVYWANHLGELAELRQNLRQRLLDSPSRNATAVAGALEGAFRQMWRRWCAHLPPVSFHAAASPTAAAELAAPSLAAPSLAAPSLAAPSLAAAAPPLAAATVPQAPTAAPAPGAAVSPIRPAAPAPIYVTRPDLPSLDEFVPYLKAIWESKVLTNGGPFHQQFEQKLGDYLGVKHVALFANCTIGLVTALQVLKVSGEVITTPYSFVATAHSLLWNGIKPVFVDIDPVTLNLDASKIEAAITPLTTAIMPVHCYGHPCDVERIQAIADSYGLKVIYDAAHAFGVRARQGNLLDYGDLSVLSFHATKVFTTFEGGAIVCPDEKTRQRVNYLKNFGFADEVTVVAPGINGKMSEFNAALGLLQLAGVERALARRQAIDERYRAGLKGLAGIECVSGAGEERSNHAYFPILVRPDYPLSRDALFQKFRANDIYVRRYFYPLISDFPMYRGLPSASHENLPVASAISRQVLCLPIYPELPDDQVDRVLSLLWG